MPLTAGHSHQNGKSMQVAQPVFFDYQNFHKHTVTENFLNCKVTINSELQTPQYQTLLKNEKNVPQISTKT